MQILCFFLLLGIPLRRKFPHSNTNEVFFASPAQTYQVLQVPLFQGISRSTCSGSICLFTFFELLGCPPSCAPSNKSGALCGFTSRSPFDDSDLSVPQSYILPCSIRPKPGTPSQVKVGRKHMSEASMASRGGRARSVLLFNSLTASGLGFHRLQREEAGNFNLIPREIFRSCGSRLASSASSTSR